MKKLILVFLVIGLAGITYAGNWTFSELAVDISDTLNAPFVGNVLEGDPANSPHGVVVAPDGNLWIAIHNGRGRMDILANGDTIYYKPIFVLDPTTGDNVSFSPIEVLTFGDGSKDTLYTDSPINGSGKGINLDNDGNILYSSWTTLYRINYQTGAGMNTYTTPYLGSITDADQDDNGNIFLGHVGSGHALYILDTDFNFVANAIESVPHLNRTLAVSNDGTDLYLGSTWNGFGIEHWHSDLPGVLPFAVVDTLGVFTDVPAKQVEALHVVTSAMDSEGIDSLWVECDAAEADSIFPSTAIWPSSLDFGPDGYLWAGVISPVWSGPKGGRFIAFDVATGLEVDQVGSPLYVDRNVGGTAGPRGATWSADGNTMYTADYYWNTITAWTYTPSGVEDVTTLPVAFQLAQNYPNPFNPTTVIQFTLAVDGAVKLTVYDITGRMVATLINQPMNAGSHVAEFDGSRMASGSYFYELVVDGQKDVRKMMLIK